MQPAPAISKRSEKLAEQFKRKHKQELLAAGPVQRNHRSKSSGPSLHRRADDDDDEDEDDCDDSHAVDDVGNRLYRTAALYKQKQEQRVRRSSGSANCCVLLYACCSCVSGQGRSQAESSQTLVEP
jgi:hypothetical protein